MNIIAPHTLAAGAKGPLRTTRDYGANALEGRLKPPGRPPFIVQSHAFRVYVKLPCDTPPKRCAITRRKWCIMDANDSRLLHYISKSFRIFPKMAQGDCTCG